MPYRAYVTTWYYRGQDYGHRDLSPRSQIRVSVGCDELRSVLRSEEFVVSCTNILGSCALSEFSSDHVLQLFIRYLRWYRVYYTESVFQTVWILEVRPTGIHGSHRVANFKDYGMNLLCGNTGS
jgi:hypothetical protein